MTPIFRKFISIPHFIIGIFLILAGSCSRIDHKQSALDPKGLVSQNQYDVFMLSVWITIFLFCAVGGCLLYVLWRYRAKTAEEAKEVPPQSHGNSMVETGLIIASSIILVILAVPTLQGIVLLNRVPDANDTESLENSGSTVVRSMVQLPLMLLERDFSGFLNIPSLELLQPTNWFSPPPRPFESTSVRKM